MTGLSTQLLSWASQGRQFISPPPLPEIHSQKMCIFSVSFLNSSLPPHSITIQNIYRKSEELVHAKEAHTAGIPLVKRFTGGGTVVVDSDSILTSFIMHGPTAVPQIPCYPRPIMSWTEGVLHSVFAAHGAFSLREHGRQK